ncbi:uncharacterized protein TRIVIDRAFT_226365 [Trichoderma virens Gv29-8]|uniref:Ankyrin repeat protein n=1 Tax=Hypocrea virens (strain Gv29-8 / FGSC 10586) TaxID=413071 RepID=G9N6Q7_HYPVG|nr:uncharacterized protein TRIVIDRAFT_226365 [Trichoderma virens Gv29-8]EHK17408.1 hypothetical protein TRIVIDRAFT_226365 [Trichoderma virens Gv29-8]UKZ53872.1 hypothetical protein TrVGV298_007674 [Trichoderma virens]
MQIRSPQRLTSSIDIVDRASSIGHSETHVHGALVSIDLNCPADLFYGRKNLVAKFSLSFTTQIQDGFHKSIAIQHAKVDYFRADNDMRKLVNGFKLPAPEIKGDYKDGKADIEIPQPNAHETNYSGNIRIIVLLDAYPSNMNVSASLSILSTADGSSRPSRAFNSVTHPQIAPSPSEERLQRLLCWTAGLGYEKLFAAYLDQEPSILDMEDEFGMTPFSCAALAGKTSVIQQALQHGGCISAREKTERGPSPLEAAARSKDPGIFDSFLIFLKYYETIDNDIFEPGEKSRLGKTPALSATEIEQELNTAVRGEQTATITKLIGMLLAHQVEHIKDDWLAHQMLQAAEKGALCLVQVLISCGANVKSEIAVQDRYGNEQRKTPLLGAIENDRIKVAKFLISHGAGNQDALHAAVMRKQHNTIRALLQVGIPVDKDATKKLLSIATDNRDSTTLMLLKLEDGTGELATSDTLDQEVDKLFEATVVDFIDDRSTKFSELTVSELMKKKPDFFKVSGKTNFKWFHLPANNMKWVEALIRKIYHYEPLLVYKVLEPKRWVKRQHEGEHNSAHARFMLPTCFDFSEAFEDKKKIGNDNKDKHVVLFMPYLYWDEQKTMNRRSELLAAYYSDLSEGETTSSIKFPPGTPKEEKLLRRYLFSGDNGKPHSRHVLHIRRTLDQSLYHNLKDTIIRDADQTVHRYQKKLNKKKREDEPLAAIMVDQLWLWILVGQSGKADTIVTCFPSRDWSDVGMNTTEPAETKPILDQRRTTDVLQITKSYIQHRPNAVKTPYDLAGVIASRCSRALLDHSTDMINFAEVYENSISDIMNEETLLFNRFNNLMQTRTKRMDGFITEHKTENKSEKYSAYQGLADQIMDDIQLVQSREMIPEISAEYCEVHRQYTLESEIPNVGEIKKLESKMNDDDKKEHLIKLLEKFGRFYVLDITREITLLSQIKDIQDELQMMEKVFAEQKDVLEMMDRIVHNMKQASSDRNGDVIAREVMAKPPPLMISGSNRAEGTNSEELQNDLDTYDDSNNDSIFGDLSSLVELKQKQNNMIDTRTARLQAEQAHSMTLEAEKQSKTLMVFTIVTIVFLPLSFIAAFFAIPTKEFDNNSLTLGFVSKVTFPASAAISLLFIAVGFSVSYWRSVIGRIHVMVHNLRNKSTRHFNRNGNDTAPLEKVVTYK